MPNTEKLRTWQVTLTTLSPLFIGSGKTLSPYSDFIQERNTLIYLNQKKIEEAISGKPELIDEYVKEVRKKMNNTTSEVSLKDFITTRLKLSLESVTLRKVPLIGTIGRQQLRQFIATAGRPFIPGSSLKGAFKTAVLFDWLNNAPDGKQALQEIHILASKNEKRLIDIDITQRCFGGISEDEFRFLHVADSEIVNFEKLEATEIKRVALSGKESECLIPNTTAKLMITIQLPTQKARLKFLHEQFLTQLFSKVKIFSENIILQELDTMDGNQDFKSFFNFYESIESQLKNIRDNEAILRLGGGKTYFDNSIGLAVDDDDSGEHLENFLLTMSMPKFWWNLSKNPHRSHEKQSPVSTNGLGETNHQ